VLPGEFAGGGWPKQLGEPQVERAKGKFYMALDKEISKLGNLVLKKHEEDGRAEEVVSGRQETASPPRQDRYIRYTASLERDFGRTLNQLEDCSGFAKDSPYHQLSM
jgi:hypothetical protein